MSISGEHPNQPAGKRPLTEIDKPTAVQCTVVAIDHKNLCYRVCKVCEKPLPENFYGACRFCRFTNGFDPGASGSKRFFRVLLTIDTDSEVLTVIMFDRAARVLFGCSANDFFEFAKTHPHAAIAASQALEGEKFSVTLSKSKKGNAQHLRVVSVVPMRIGFQAAIHTLRELFSARQVNVRPNS